MRFHGGEERGVRALDLVTIAFAEQAARRDDLGFDVHQHVDRHRVHGIARGRGEPAVELEIELTRIAAARHHGEALVEQRAQLFHVEVGRALGGEPRHLGLHDEPRFGELRGGETAELQQRAEVARHHARVERAHEVAARGALAHFEQSTVLERAQRFAHGDTARAEAPPELALGRKLVAARQSPLVHRALEVRHDVVIDARSAGGRQHGATLRRKDGEVKRASPRLRHYPRLLSVAMSARSLYGGRE